MFITHLKRCYLRSWSAHCFLRQATVCLVLKNFLTLSKNIRKTSVRCWWPSEIFGNFQLSPEGFKCLSKVFQNVQAMKILLIFGKVLVIFGSARKTFSYLWLSSECFRELCLPSKCSAVSIHKCLTLYIFIAICTGVSNFLLVIFFQVYYQTSNTI